MAAIYRDPGARPRCTHPSLAPLGPVRSDPASIASRRARTGWVRRWATAVGVACLGAGALVLALGVGPGSRPSQPGVGASGGRVYVVRAGDTVWGVATRLDPGGDPRPLVDRLEAQVPGGVLRAGQRLVLPGPTPAPSVASRTRP
ncbi:MAG TPA: LysM domain-containing protein [Acidimicrobiales bacterium]|jgi:hypothetical protein|nr:LysM domain-containing protein [Acidimicrobiales bacterium]